MRKRKLDQIKKEGKKRFEQKLAEQGKELPLSSVEKISIKFKSVFNSVKNQRTQKTQKKHEKKIKEKSFNIDELKIEGKRSV